MLLVPVMAQAIQSEEDARIAKSAAISEELRDYQVPAAQFRALENKYDRLDAQVNGKKGFNQRLKNVEREFTSKDGVIVKVRSIANDAKKLAEDNGKEIFDLKAKVQRHEKWLIKLTAAYNETDKTVRGLAADAVTTSLLFIYGLAMIVIIIIAVFLIVWFFTRKKAA